MSVTFTTTFQPTGRVCIVHSDFEAGTSKVWATFDTVEDAELAFISHDLRDSAGMHEYYGIEGEDVYGLDRIEVNLANSNAGALFKAMGLPVEFSGQMTPAEFRDHLLVLLVGIEDPGTSVVEYTGENGALILDVGRRPGQLNEYAERLMELVDQAEERGVAIQWG